MPNPHDRDPAIPWSGRPLTLQVGRAAAMASTTNGSMVLAYWSKGDSNNAGQITLTSGGGDPIDLPVPALANAPSLYVANWHADNLTVTNTSVAADTPIEIEAYGPGLPGFDIVPLVIGSAVQLGVLEVAQGKANSGFMTLTFKADSGSLSILALIGGPVDDCGNNAYVFALNASVPSPEGYTKVTAGNSLSYSFNWGAATLFVVNLSPSTGAPVKVTLSAV